MTFTWSFSTQFAKEFANFPKDQQDKVLDFVDTFENFGLADWFRYPGKISYSWKNLAATDPAFVFASANDLWHYHIGIPVYVTVPGRPYQTSDWVLHFQWPGKGSHIDVVDLYQHYTVSRAFYLPPAQSLAIPDPNSPAPTP